MTRANLITFMIRGCLVILTLSVSILVFGPFGGAETAFGLTDKEAHALAFYGLSVMALLALPRVRKWDVALVCCAIGGLIEVVQGVIGRDCDVRDWLADSVGILLAVGPMSFESFRVWARGGTVSHPKRRQSDHKSDHKSGHKSGHRTGRALARVHVED